MKGREGETGSVTQIEGWKVKGDDDDEHVYMLLKNILYILYLWWSSFVTMKDRDVCGTDFNESERLMQKP